MKSELERYQSEEQNQQNKIQEFEAQLSTNIESTGKQVEDIQK